MSHSDEPATRCRAVVLAAVLLAAALATESADALLCTGGSIDVWPPSGEIPPEPVFVLHATGQRSSWVAELVASRVYLETEGGRIDLLELRRFEAERAGVAQIVLAPAEPLPSGHDYSLVVEASQGIGGRAFSPTQSLAGRAGPGP